MESLQIAKRITPSISSSTSPQGSAGTVAQPEKFKAMLDEAIQDQVAMNAEKAAGVVEELTPEMATQFFAQIMPEKEYNPKIDRFDRNGIPVARPADAEPASDWTFAQADAGVAPVGTGGGQNPNQQAVDEILNRPLNAETAGGTAPGVAPPRMQVTPFQFFLDKAVDFFLRVSDLERKTDVLMVDYAQGRVSLEEVMVEKAKVSVALSFSVTLVNQVTQSFKEIQNMQV
ncbi:hypothetical protein EBR96_00035 [bacterium]|nr:hypothetical protein [bacterium]